MKVTVSDGSGKILEDAVVDFGGQSLTGGEHSLEVPPLTELKGCSLAGYVLDSPSIGWRVPTDEDDVELRTTLELRALRTTLALRVLVHGVHGEAA